MQTNNLVIKKVVKRTLSYIKSHELPFTRSISDEYLYKITEANARISLNVLSDKDLEESLYLKNIYIILNIIIDDEIDCYRKDTYLQNALIFMKMGKCNISWIEEILILINNPQSEKYLNKIFEGFLYEYNLSINSNLISSDLYTQYCSLTADVMILIAFEMNISKNIYSDEIFIIEKICEALNISLKYASDIGSLPREINKEKSLNNIVLIRAIEDNLIVENDILESTYSELVEKLASIIDNIAYKSEINLRLSIKLSKSLKKVSLQSAIDTVSYISKLYIKGIDVFQ